MGFRRSFSKHYAHSNLQLNKVCALWKYSEWWASSRSNGFQKFFKTLYTFKHTIEQCMRSVKVHWAVGFKQKQWLAEEVFETLCTFKPTIEQSMPTVKIQWVVGLKQKQWVSEEFFQNIMHIQAYNWTMYALCKSTLSGGLQAGAMARRRSFFKHYTHSNIQLNKVYILWKYTEWWASSSSNGFQKKFFKTFNIFKHTIEQSMRSVKVHWVVGFKQKQWLAEEVFWNIIHIQTYNWTMYALCESKLNGGIQAEAMARRRSFSKHFTFSSIQLNNLCALWKYTEWWASSRSNGLQKKFLKTLYIFKHTVEQSMPSVKVHWVVGFKQKQWILEEYFQNIIHIQTNNWTMYALCKSTLSGGLQPEAMASRRSFLKHYTHSNIHLNKICALWKYSEWWASSGSNGFQKKFFKTLCTFKPTIEQSMRSVKVPWVVGFKQKQWVSEVFQNIIHIQTYNWTMYALCQSTLSGGIQAEAMARRRSFLKHYAHSNLQLNKVCPLWKHSEWWASSRSNGFQKNFFKTLCIFKHTIEQCMHSVKVHWVVGFKQDQWLAEDFFSKHYTYSNIQLNNVCAL